MENFNDRGRPEEKEPKTYTTKNLDWDRFFQDFYYWATEKSDVEETRIDRYLKNMFHMAGIVATGGLYPMFYLGYFVYKFTQSVDMDKYKVEVEHTVRERDQ